MAVKLERQTGVAFTRDESVARAHRVSGETGVEGVWNEGCLFEVRWYLERAHTGFPVKPGQKGTGEGDQAGDEGKHPRNRHTPDFR